MTTEIVVTGTGSPTPRPGRAGPGVLVRSGDVSLQVDAGRATSLRLSEAGIQPQDLSGLLITHHHYDHLTGVEDIVLARWLAMRSKRDYFPMLAPAGASAKFVSRIMDIWEDDIAVRQLHMDIRTSPAANLEVFSAKQTPELVWEHDGVKLFSGLVHHEPVEPSVAYRFETPDGIVTVSGDTKNCEEMEILSQGADILVHEAMRKSIFPNAVVADYHADTIELGAMAQRAGVKKLVLYHLLPSPETPADERAFYDDVIQGGFKGEVVVAKDLTRVAI